MRYFPFAAGAALLMLAACAPSDDGAFDPTASPYFQSGDRMVSADGTEFRYRASGPEEAQTVLLLHGFTDSLEGWESVADELDEDFRVIRPDLPGHGLSGADADGDLSNAATVEAVAAFMSATGTHDAVIVGNSLGGLIAWRLAEAHPDRVSGLVLLAPGGVPHNGVGDSPVEVPAMLRFYLKTAPKAGVRAALQAMHADPERVTQARIDQYADLMRGHGEGFVARARQFTLPDPETDLAKIAAPTTIVWGLQDTVLPPAHADVFEANIPDATVIRLDGVGHLPQSEATIRVAQAIR
ncbi:MAG: alpha/beta fold hydrolase, partial [Litorimonas sp.]